MIRLSCTVMDLSLSLSIGVFVLLFWGLKCLKMFVYRCVRKFSSATENGMTPLRAGVVVTLRVVAQNRQE